MRAQDPGQALASNCEVDDADCQECDPGNTGEQGRDPGFTRHNQRLSLESGPLHAAHPPLPMKSTYGPERRGLLLRWTEAELGLIRATP